MLDLMRELGFIKESRAVRLSKNSLGKPIGERYDKVTYLREHLPEFDLDLGSPVYVESARFLPLVPFIASAKAEENYLQVFLRNGADYKLPYLGVEFSIPDITVGNEYLCIHGKLNFSALKKTALQNLVKPEMRCIYVDEKGAVSCNFIQGTVDKNIKTLSGQKLLLPPDLVVYIPDGEQGSIYVSGEYIVYETLGRDYIIAPLTELSEEESPWYDIIYNKAQIPQEGFAPIPAGLEEALKRLQCFGNDVVISADTLTVESNFEPISLPGAHGGEYTVEEVLSVLGGGKEILFKDTEMYLKNENITIMVSEKSDE